MNEEYLEVDLKSIVRLVNIRNWEKNLTRVMNAWIMGIISILTNL